MIKNTKYFFAILFFLSIFLKADERVDFIKGADLSALLDIEDHGGVYKDSGVAKDALHILKERGVNAVRLRLWHTPESYNNLEKTLEMAQRIKAMQMGFLLDFHFSDTWADPGRQTKPAAWENLSFDVLKDSVYQYTKNVLSALYKQGTPPDMVQIGNEIICGLLWDEGRVCDAFNNSTHWGQLAQLINEATRGVRDSFEAAANIKIIIHIDRGGDNGGCRWFYDHLLEQDVEFDIIGLSYYPWWHGPLKDFESNINDLAQRYGKDILIVETAYPWSLGWNDNTHNLVGNEDQLHQGYPATVDGQKRFLVDQFTIINSIPNNRGLGLFYWAPDWISTSTSGSPWENVALFNFDGEVLPSTSAFDSVYSHVSSLQNVPVVFRLYPNHPNPFNPSTTIQFDLNRDANVTQTIYNTLGHVVRILNSGLRSAGSYSVSWDGTDANGTPVPSGVYVCSLQSDDQYDFQKMVLIR